jgi:predicted DCC family thiol-disulfide oxidoreductase YuxK
MIATPHRPEQIASPPTNLPSPTDLPRTDVVIYDGACQFCLRQVDRLRRLDGKGRLAFLSLHEPAVRELCPNLTHEQLMEQMYVRDTRGGQHGGVAALRYLARRLPRLWPLLPLLYIPFCLPLLQWLYRQVATRRYQWNKEECESGTCKAHFR